MTSRSVDSEAITCPDCGRPVQPGARLCDCGFPLIFLETEQPPERPLKPTRRPRGDDDTDEIPTVHDEAPRPAVTPAAPLSGAPAPLVCRNCTEHNEPARTWCARCGHRLRDVAPVTEALPAATPEQRSPWPAKTLIVVAAVLGVLALAGAVLYLTQRDNNPPLAEAVEGPLTVARITATATARSSTDDARALVTYDVRNVLDGNLSTAWRAQGTAPQEIVLTLDRQRSVNGVALVPGYAKKDPKTGKSRFEENHTVVRALWRFDDGSRLVQDIANPQPQWAEKRLARPTLTRTVTLEIVKTGNPKADRDYTAISDVRITGR